jgi:hypothetical protein
MNIPSPKKKIEPAKIYGIPSSFFSKIKTDLVFVGVSPSK